MTSQTVQPPHRHPLGPDLIAGVVVFLVALPLCLGIAHASGAPLQAGLLSGIVGGIIVGSLSGSHVSVSGPAAGLAAIVAAQISKIGYDGFLAAVVMAGCLQIVFGLLRGGGLSNYFPTNVIKGLLAAIGILLILKQFPHLIGHDIVDEGMLSFRQPDGENTFTEMAVAIRRYLPGATLIGFVSLATLVVWENTRLKKAVLPGALAAVMIGTGLNELLVALESSWAVTGKHLVQVPVIGKDGIDLDNLIRFPDFARLLDTKVVMAALTLAIVASLETLLNLEATDRLDPLRRVSPTDRELWAQGIGNIVAGSLGGLPVTSVIVRSSVNVNAGGRTRRSTVFHGALLAVSVLFLAGLINHIPLATLAAVLVFTGIKLASPRLFQQMWRAGRNQFLPFVVTVVAIVLTDLLKGVLVGMGTSAAFILWRNLRGGFLVHRESHVGGIVNRIELSSQANFVHRAQLKALLARFGHGDQVAIDARGTDYIDPDILLMIRDFVEEVAPARGLSVSLVGFEGRHQLSDVIKYVDYSSREVQSSLTPLRVLQILREGNDRFCSGQPIRRDARRLVDVTAAAQHPIAVVLSCIDSRAPAEILFDLGIGDIFSVRVAGNVAKQKALGSMEFACKMSGAKLIVVLGHTRCGAVKATCEFVTKGIDPVASTGMTNLDAITSVISLAVTQEAASTRPGPDGVDAAFVDRVAQRHVLNTVMWILEQSPTLRAMVDAGDIGIAGAIYDVSTGRVEFLTGSRALGIEPILAARA